MNVLKQSRGHLKGGITRAHSYISEVDDENIDSLRTRLERLEETWKAFVENHDELIQYFEEEGYGDPEVDFEATEVKYIQAKSAFLKAIRKITPPPPQTRVDASHELFKKQAAVLENLLKNPSSSSASKVSAEIELPQFKISPFGGEYREWPEFRDMFLGSVDCKQKLPGAQKMRYLKSFLRDDAAKLLNGIKIADSNYEEAWEKLERRYNKPLYIINAHIESFVKLPTVVVADSGHLRKLTDKADEVIRGLKALESETRDPWLIYLLLNKTDLETRKAWALHINNSEKATVQELIDFLEERCDALEACESRPSESKNRGNRNLTRSASASNNIKSFAISNLVCPKCKENHALPQCPEFLKLTIMSRRSYVRDQRLCYNCLCGNHSASRCRSKTKCPHCTIRHHALVHLDPSVSEANNAEKPNAEKPSTSKADPLPLHSNHAHNEIPSACMLPTVVVQVVDVFGKAQRCRMLLDTGSQVSFVTEGLVKRLGLRRRHARHPISGISSLEAGVTQGAVDLNLKSCFDSNEMRVEAFILNKITSKTPVLPFAFPKSLLLEGLKLADPGFNTPGTIDILLGSDKAWNILRDGRRIDGDGNVIAHNTIFGWVITGNISDQEIVSFHVSVEQDIDVLLKSFWEIEELPHRTYSLDAEGFADEHFCNTFSRAPDNKYIVELPFRHKDIKFGNTVSGALSRLFAMERRFTRHENLRLEYCRFMKAYQELGHMERIPDNEIEPTSGKIFYLPHHAVVTNKLRVVFDGSHKDGNGISLNEMLHIGPPLQRNLINVCLRFRMHRYVFCADIVKMFRQIWVDTKHRDFQRIVWRESPDKPIGHYRLRTVTYGTSPAPFLAMRVLKQLALDYLDQFPIASHSILHDCYVDDIMTGSDSVSKVLELKKELVDLLSCGGLQLSKWSSNCWPVLKGLDCEQAVSLDFDSANNWTKVLGLVWNPHRDIFTFKISLDNNNKSSSSPTKRMLLSEISKIYDPLGFLAPATILFKMLFQELWVHKAKIGWDDPLPTEVAAKWISYRNDLIYFEKVEILRRCTLNSKRFDLIGFSDASEKAYSAVVYARCWSESGDIEIQLVAAKTRVAPVKQLTIPRLELCGALLLSRLVQLIRTSLDAQPFETFVFCDSQIVLAWLSSSPRRWNTFIANRTSEILGILPRSDWNYIRSEENPADCASRGVEPRKLWQLEIWWKGPAWLWMDTRSWPIAAEKVQLDEVPERRKNPVVANVLSAEEGILDALVKRVSSWFRIIRIVAFVLRFTRNCKFSPNDRLHGFLRASELFSAKQICILWAQEEFAEEIQSLKSDKCVSNRSKLSPLSPFLDNVGLLRVGGRLSNAVNIPFNVKHPIVLPKGHPITRLILRDAHLKFIHAGVSELFSLVRQEFWILGSRNLIRKIVHDCMKCFRQRQSTSTQLMGNMRASRLSPSFAFAHTGCDYAGPITLRLAKGRKPKLIKGYFALFVCMVTKALHLEVVSDLSTDAFLAALRRFIARRGKCSVIYSDNGTNFQGAARTLSEWYRLVRSQEHNEQISTTLAAEGIKWEFIPPHSPHFGGLWEAGVKCVKQHLRRAVGNNILTFEEMSTLLSQIEAILNSRPLCALSDSDLNPLTPSHFVIGRPYTAIPEPSCLEVPLNRLGRWELIQNMLQGFWRRWHTDYLTSLQQRPKWKNETRNIQIGDLVVVKEPNMPPSKWALGRIEELHPGQDELVRVVSVRTQNGLFKRPITKLAILPCS